MPFPPSVTLAIALAIGAALAAPDALIAARPIAAALQGPHAAEAAAAAASILGCTAWAASQARARAPMRRIRARAAWGCAAAMALHGLAALAGAGRSAAAWQQATPSTRTATFGPATLTAIRIERLGSRRPHAGGFRTQAIVQRVAERRGHDWQRARGRVRLELPGELALGRGDICWMRMQLRALRPASAPWAKSEVLAARSDNVDLVGRSTSPIALVSAGAGLGAACDRLRTRWAATIDVHLPAASAAIVKALALGDAGSVAPEVRAAFADAGMAHLLAVSGLHVSLVYGGATRAARGVVALCGGLWPMRWAHAGATVAVWAYTALAGASHSAQRAAVMASSWALAVAIGLGGARPAHGWGMALTVLLALDPLAVQSPGAVLSFACVAGLMLLAPFAPTAAAHGRLRRLVASGALGAALMALTWPLCAAYFGRASWIAPLTNLLAIPYTTLVATPLALLTASLLGVGAPAWLYAPACRVCDPALAGLCALAAQSAALPMAATLASPWPTEWTLALWGLACAASAWRRESHLPPTLRRWRRHRLVAVACGVCVLAALGLRAGAAPFGPWPRGAMVRVFVLDVGQGDATLIEFERGRWALIDGGGAAYPGARDPGQTVVAPALQALRVRKLDLVVLTHPHPDHMNGLAYVFAHWPVGTFAYNDDSSRSPFVRTLAGLVRTRGGRSELAKRSYAFGDAGLELLQPLHGQNASANDHSLVAIVRAFGQSVLVAGDVERRGEADLLGHLPKVDVLRVGHHGSKTSSSVPFLQALAPRLAIVSCGANNRFGFPHPTTTANLSAVARRTLTTAECGTIELRLQPGRTTWRAGDGASPEVEF